MNEDTGIVFMFLFWAMLAIALYQRFWTIRRLRRKLDQHVEGALSAARDVRIETPAAPTGDIRRLEERLQVLERITVEKENVLAREIEDLRSARA